MNILDWILNGGAVKTAHGRPVTIWLTDDDQYPIEGKVDDNVPFECRWDENGYPHNLPLTHGLNLLAVKRIVNYHTLSKDELARL